MKFYTMFIPVFLIFTTFLLASFHSGTPLLFVVGDSISIQYGPYLKEYLNDVLEIDRKQNDGEAMTSANVPKNANGGDSGMALAYLRARFLNPDFQPDYLLVNAGLHDIKRAVPEENLQVKPDQYRENLNEIVKLVKSRNVPMIWVRSTPVVDSIHNSRSSSVHRYSKDLEQYNQIADEVMKYYNIPVIDLYEFTKKLGTEAFTDHVHYDNTTQALQAAFIAGNLKQILRTY